MTRRGANAGVPKRPFKDACMKPVVAEMVDIDPPWRPLAQIAPHRCRHGRQEQRVGGGPAITVVDDHDVELVLRLAGFSAAQSGTNRGQFARCRRSLGICRVTDQAAASAAICFACIISSAAPISRRRNRQYRFRPAAAGNGSTANSSMQWRRTPRRKVAKAGMSECAQTGKETVRAAGFHSALMIAAKRSR
jgi:hypothetical protein